MNTNFAAMHIRTIAIALSLFAFAGTASTASAEPAKMYNPVLWADVPDPDVIRVGDDYYMVSTTMHLTRATSSIGKS